MLPWLDKKKTVTLIRSKRGDRSIDVKNEVGGQDLDPGLKSAAEKLLQAVNDKSVMAIAEALKDAYSSCESGESEAPEEGAI